MARRRLAHGRTNVQHDNHGVLPTNVQATSLAPKFQAKHSTFRAKNSTLFEWFLSHVGQNVNSKLFEAKPRIPGSEFGVFSGIQVPTFAAAILLV